MIPAEDYKKQRKLYSHTGGGLWKIIGYCESPTIIMQNIHTGERESFGIGGLTAQTFEPIGELPENYQLPQPNEDR